MAAERHCARWFRNDPRPGLMVLAGDPGTGKTATARAIHRWCSRHAMLAFEQPVGRGWGSAEVPSTTWCHWPTACDLLGKGVTDAMEEYLHAAHLTLDDVGAETDAFRKCVDKLCQILSKRERKFTVVTTNVLPANWNNRFDVRVADRFLRNSEIVTLEECGSYAARNA